MRGTNHTLIPVLPVQGFDKTFHVFVDVFHLSCFLDMPGQSQPDDDHRQMCGGSIKGIIKIKTGK